MPHRRKAGVNIIGRWKLASSQAQIFEAGTVKELVNCPLLNGAVFD
jgi:hypothetical protein